jgi:hypothetical protein
VASCSSAGHFVFISTFAQYQPSRFRHARQALPPYVVREGRPPRQGRSHPRHVLPSPRKLVCLGVQPPGRPRQDDNLPHHQVKNRPAGSPMEKAVRKNVQPRSHALLDENVVEFVILAEEEGVSISGAMIVQHAQDVATKLRIPPDLQPRFGPSWLRRFQERYGFRWRRAYGESDSVELDTSKQEIARLRRLVSSYLPRNVFNMDESPCSYNDVPRGSICKIAAPALKQSKARVTMAVCCNTDGSEKLTVLYLGTTTKPRWFSSKHMFLSRRPVSSCDEALSTRCKMVRFSACIFSSRATNHCWYIQHVIQPFSVPKY